MMYFRAADGLTGKHTFYFVRIITNKYTVLYMSTICYILFVIYGLVFGKKNLLGLLSYFVK